MANEYFAEFNLKKKLGKGIFGKVYSVVHSVTSQKLALKLLRHDLTDSSEFSDRFYENFERLKGLHNKNISQIHEYGCTDGDYWFSMDLAPGDGAGSITLQNLADRNGGILAASDLIGLLSEVLRAVSVAHEQGIVHWNLKPGNILLYRLPDGRVVTRVVDFSLVPLIGSEAYLGRVRKAVKNSLKNRIPMDMRGASSRALLKSREYMSPEQQRTGRADFRSDVYSIGLMFYRLISGAKLSPRPPSHFNNALSSDHDRFIIKALEPDPDDRYADAGKMLEALEPIRELINREIEQKRRVQVSDQIQNIRKRVAELIATDCDEKALEILWQTMQDFPGRRDILDDYSVLEEKVRENRLVAEQEKQYQQDSREACALESAGNPEDALKVWGILAELFPEKSQPIQEVERLRLITGQSSDGETVEDIGTVDQAAILRERITYYRRLRNEAWDFVDEYKFEDALRIITGLKEEFSDRDELISELEMIEEETLESLAQEQKITRDKKRKRFFLTGIFVVVIIILVLIFIQYFQGQ
ncbi:serine/threonine protein kinase [bacterium]|nr:serine/threonine protein kinase [bacterium]